MFFHGRVVVAWYLHVAASIAAVSSPEVGVTAAAIGRPGRISTRTIRRFLLLPLSESQTAQIKETLPEFGRHQIIENRINR